MADRRRIFVGDVQGCREELEELLEALRYDPAADELHPVGDLVNRGPDSLGCLRLLSALAREGTVGGVLGNHDLLLLACARGDRAARPGDTLGDVLAAPDRDELCAWLARRPFVRAFDDVVLVHAGLSPAWEDPVAELEGEDPAEPGPAARFAVSVRWCAPDGSVPPDGADPAPEPFRPWHRLFDRARVGGRTVVFGHWARRGLLVDEGLRGVDSGCVWGHELSAWVAEEDRIVQVPARRTWAAVGG